MADVTIENPTYMAHIRHFFEDIDLDHMNYVGVDLSTYDALKARATDVYFQTLPPNANMPPSPERKWSQQRSDTFLNWIRIGHPFGEPVPQIPEPTDAGRVRKDLRDLSKKERKILAKAFEGLMTLPPDDPDSYFALAGLHWYPLPNHCKHHEDRYNPWHRAYLERFEDAMRTVDGCEDVTLPYWDITAVPPKFLFSPPFDAYTLPIDIHPNYPAGYTTERNERREIANGVRDAEIADTIDHAMKQPVWRDFVTFTGEGIEGAHDAGHVVSGPTLASPDAASFDPLFWFFHSNWDRLWWEWQQVMSATTLWKFRSTIRGSTLFLEAGFNELDPFTRTADQTIDLTAMDIGYKPREPLVAAAPMALERAGFGSLTAARGVKVKSVPQASVRLKGINRLNIPGSFRAVLKAGGEPVANRSFFQSTQPRECENCVKNSHIDLDFLVDLSDIQGKSLAVQIELAAPRPDIAPRIPLHSCGDPTLNVRLLLEERNI